jgi:glycosyltransferase involved in cell wall biosynthesis
MLQKRLVILTPYEPNRIGGIERLVREFAKRLKDAYELQVICTGELAKEFTDGFPTKVVKGYPFLFAYAPKLRETVELAKPSIIYAHGYSTYIAFVAWQLKKSRPNTKLVLHTHFHTSGANPTNSLLRSVYDRFIGPRIIKCADAIIANSYSELSELIRRAREFDMGANIIPILFVSRLERYKNPLLAVRVMKHLSENFHLFIIGEGPEKKSVQSVIRSTGMTNRVHLLGKVTDDELYRWYKTAHVFLHFSASESFGMTCIEALAAGTPVIANDDGHGLSETIRLFPEFIKSCKVNTDKPDHIAKLVERTVQMKPVHADVSKFDWDELTNQLAHILGDAQVDNELQYEL